MAKLNLIGLSNAMTDIIINVTESEMAQLRIKKLEYNRLKDIDEQAFFSLISEKKQRICQAGSPANVIFNCSALGLETALMGSIGDDKIGRKYLSKLKRAKIQSCLQVLEGESGICYILLTPDKERTNLAAIGVSGNFTLDTYIPAKILHTSF